MTKPENEFTNDQNLPLVWPIHGESKHNYLDNIFSKQPIKKGVFIVTDITLDTASWLLNHFPKNSNSNWLIILCINLNGFVAQKTLNILYEFSSLYPTEFQIKILIPKLINSNIININLCYWIDEYSGNNTIFLGTSPSLGQGIYENGFINVVSEPDVILFKKYFDVIDGYWKVAMPLTLELCNIPEFQFRNPSPLVLEAWSCYCSLIKTDYLFEKKTPQGTHKIEIEKENEKETTIENPVINQESSTPLWKRLNIIQPTNIEIKLFELSKLGHGIKLKYNSPPLEASLPPQLLGLEPSKKIGSIKKTTSYKVELFDKDINRLLESKRSGVRDLLNLLSYSYSDGEWWIPNQSDILLKKKMDEFKTITTDLLTEQGPDGVKGFLEKRKKELNEACNTYYQEQYPKLDFPQKQLDKVLRFLADKLSDIFTNGVLPTLNPFSIQLIFNSNSEHEDAWAIAATFLEDLAIRPRKLLSNNIDSTLDKNLIEVDEYIKAMNIMDDSIWKLYNENAYNVTRIAKEEMKQINDITASTVSSLVKCEKYLKIIEGL